MVTAAMFAHPPGQSRTEANRMIRLCPITTPTAEVMQYFQNFWMMGRSYRDWIAGGRLGRRAEPEGWGTARLYGAWSRVKRRRGTRPALPSLGSAECAPTRGGRAAIRRSHPSAGRGIAPRAP